MTLFSLTHLAAQQSYLKQSGFLCDSHDKHIKPLAPEYLQLKLIHSALFCKT